MSMMRETEHCNVRGVTEENIHQIIWQHQRQTGPYFNDDPPLTRE